jgi:hypothetical protein
MIDLWPDEIKLIALRTLFWNLNRKPLQSLITTLTVQHQIYVLIFAECSIKSDVLLQSLSQANLQFYHLPNEVCEKIEKMEACSNDVRSLGPQELLTSLLLCPARTDTPFTNYLRWRSEHESI